MNTRFRCLLTLFSVLAVACLCPAQLSAQREDGQHSSDSTRRLKAHFQFTSVYQYKPSLRAPYSGINSLSTDREKALSITSTLFLGYRIGKNTAIYFNPEIAGGTGLSQARGVAGFPNGESFRVGDPTPTAYVARFYLRHYFPFGEARERTDPDDLLEAQHSIPTEGIMLQLGKFSLADRIDGNSFSHDPRTQFLNWSLMSSGAFDFAANTRGYTSGIVLEYFNPRWSFRLASVMVPIRANDNVMDENFGKARADNIEIERRHSWGGRPGAIRAIAFRTVSRAGNYRAAIAALAAGDSAGGNVNEGQPHGGLKYGFAVSAEQQVGEHGGVFARLSWNDGAYATWAFTEIDQSLALGYTLTGHAWKRPKDNIGIAAAVNGISSAHRDYLAAGGYGFIIGDGRLPNYSPELVTELFYQVQVARAIWITGDYQFVANPAYNPDRGPAHVFSIRAHVQL
jgi:high affinity Mn2+ porin